MEVSQRRRFMHKILSMVMAVTMICTMMCGTVISASASDYGFVNPISGTVQGAGYDESAGHYGIDLYPYNYGDPVYAVASGTITYSCEENHTKVIQAGDDCGSVKILLDEPFSYNGYTYVSAFYTHMSDLVYDIYCGFNSGCIADYNAGARDDALESGSIHVEAGEIIGYVGKGNAATHLHLSFETGEDSNYHMMPNSEYYEVFGWSYNDSIIASTSGDETINTLLSTRSSNIVINGVDIGYAHGSFFTKNGSTCKDYNNSSSNGTCHRRGDGYDCTRTTDTSCNCMRYWPTGDPSSYQVDLLASQCWGYARYCQWKVYGYYDIQQPSYYTDLTGRLTSYTGATLKSKLINCAPATHVRAGDSHSIIIIDATDYGVNITDCNSSNMDCHVEYRTYSWDQLATYLKSFGSVNFVYSWNQGGSTTHSCVYSITEYEAAHPHKAYVRCSCGKFGGYTEATTYVSSCASCNEVCTCATSYAGTYTCVTTTYPLTIRSGHGTSFSAVGSIPSGAMVTVTKANGTGEGYWGHVEYGGVSGYASMEYLVRNDPSIDTYPLPFKAYTLSDANHAADAFDAPNGNHIGYIYGTDYCTVKEIYSNGFCLVNCPWDGGYKDVYTWIGCFLNSSSAVRKVVVEEQTTTYIRLRSSTELGWVDAGDQVTVVDDSYSDQKQIIYPHTDGTYRCAWVEADALLHKHSPGPAATCTTSQTCTTCDAILAGVKSHTPGAAATCTSNQVCTVCNAILAQQTSHTPGTAATCTTPQTCTVCGTTLNKAKGHSYTAGDYTEPTHPHTIYNTCACGAMWDSGYTADATSCTECYPAPTVTGITYTPSTVKVGDTVTFTLNATGATAYQIVIGDGTNVLLRTEITSDNTATYTFNTEGSYSVWGYAYNGETSATSSTIYVTVGSANIPVTGISLNTSSASISVDETITLTATVSPSDATDKSVTWTSSDASVATVVNGVVTGVKAGTATITVTTTDGEFAAECVITVEADEQEVLVDTPIITVSNVTGRAGGTVDVTINIDKNPGITGAILKVNYDSALSLDYVVAGEAFSTLTLAELAVPYMNPLVLSWDGTVDDYNAGTLVTMTFKIPEGAEAGEYPITITYDTDDIYDGDFNDVAISVKQGAIQVTDIIYGDVNDDGKINGKDLTMIRRAISGGFTLDVYIEEAADVNLDGKVNGKDLTLIRRYISGGFDVILGQ